MARFNILYKAGDLLDYVLNITDKSPKKLIGDIIPRFRNLAMNVVENVERANVEPLNSPTRLNYQKEADINLAILDLLAERCVKFSYLTHHQLKVLTEMTAELSKMFENWKKADVERFKLLNKSE